MTAKDPYPLGFRVIEAGLLVEPISWREKCGIPDEPCSFRGFPFNEGLCVRCGRRIRHPES